MAYFIKIALRASDRMSGLFDNNKHISVAGGKHDYKDKGERALWDNLDDMISLVSELYEVNYAAV